MGLIKLTGVPDDVHRRLKADAAAHGLTLTQWCIDKLSNTEFRLGALGGVNATPQSGFAQSLPNLEWEEYKTAAELQVRGSVIRDGHN
jgi:hypothetical protein